MFIRRTAIAVMVAAAAALVPGAPAPAAPARAQAPAYPEPCFGWRRLIQGETGRNAIVEPGAPWHVRLGVGGNGFQNFMFCRMAADKWAFAANANEAKYLTANTQTGEVTATGGNPTGFDYWFVCTLERNGKWLLIRFTATGHYLFADSNGYLVARTQTPNGSMLWHRSEFTDALFPLC